MQPQQRVLQNAGTVEPNSVRLNADKAERIVEALNIDLAGTAVLHHQLRKHQWTVTGTDALGYVRFFHDGARDVSMVVDELADRIRTLGGVPISSPAALERHSPIPFEGEDVYDVRSSLWNDLQAFGDLIEQTSSHIELAKSYGDHATAEILRRQLLVFEDYASLIDRFLAEESSTPE